ncbi:MAG: 4Fe-4S dicluster domain-containing protein [Omnitrophica bacterium]|nr:4Fe-4S dicluster domain-containing protein [Candidatus Omnitrophota bacterium]
MKKPIKGNIVIDADKCVACKTCELACSVAHSRSKDLVWAIYEKPISPPRIKVESTDEFVVPLQCRHCEDAPCIKICPTKAITRADRESPVLIDQGKCIGCKWCVLVCPFGVINMDKDGKFIIKCDLCFERLKQGEKPACVVSCPTHALQFKTVKEISKEKKKEYLINIKKGKKE